MTETSIWSKTHFIFYNKIIFPRTNFIYINFIGYSKNQMIRSISIDLEESNGEHHSGEYGKDEMVRSISIEMIKIKWWDPIWLIWWKSNGEINSRWYCFQNSSNWYCGNEMIPLIAMGMVRIKWWDPIWLIWWKSNGEINSRWYCFQNSSNWYCGNEMIPSIAMGMVRIKWWDPIWLIWWKSNNEIKLRWYCCQNNSIWYCGNEMIWSIHTDMVAGRIPVDITEIKWFHQFWLIYLLEQFQWILRKGNGEINCGGYCMNQLVRLIPADMVKRMFIFTHLNSRIHKTLSWGVVFSMS